MMWQFFNYNYQKKWVLIASFDSLIKAARHINSMEGVDVDTGIFFRIYVDQFASSDEEVLSSFECKSKKLFIPSEKFASNAI
jgi:hypothetical protein